MSRNSELTRATQAGAAKRAAHQAWRTTGATLAALLLCAAVTPVQAGADVCRVTPAGSAGNDGSTWSQAMTLSAALAEPACTEIWVAEGRYLTGPAGDRDASFAIRSGTAVFGGFAGTESTRDQRDIATRRSVLSGDIGDDDVVDAFGVTTEATGIQGMNSYHVVTLQGPVDVDTVLDGFVITGGMADKKGQDFSDMSGGGLLCAGLGEGADCRPLLRNLLVRGNRAMTGAGMACIALEGAECEPVLENSALVNNAASFGGGLVIVGTGLSESVWASGDAAGAVREGVARGQANGVLDNVTFTGNQATNGAALYVLSGGPGESLLTARNVTISGNGLLDDKSTAIGALFGRLNLVNSIVWNNGPMPFEPGQNEIQLEHSLIQGGCPATANCVGLVAGDPGLGALDETHALAPVLVPALAGPAVDSGDCALSPADDQRGVARPAGAACDLGAVEFRQAQVSVKVTGAGRVSALPTVPALSGAIVDCRDDSGSCHAWYSAEAGNQQVTLRLWPDSGLLATASGCGGSQSGTYFTTGALQDDCTVSVSFALPQAVLGGTVTGLQGSGLALHESVSGQTAVIQGTGNLAFAFDEPVAAGTPYTVTILQQPSQPSQSCVVLNGGGTVGNSDISSIVVHCGAAEVYSVGGTLTGLAAGADVAIRINGGDPQVLAGNGPFVFPDLFVTGDGYHVDVATQPADQSCTVTNGDGVIGQASVTNVQVDCVKVGAQLHLQVVDDGSYQAYGNVRTYRVMLSNSGSATATGVSLAATFDPVWDMDSVQWECVSNTQGAACSPTGSGGFADTVTVPAGRTVVWLVHAAVPADSDAAQATVTVTADGAAPVTDTNTLVLFRDGLDVPYGERGDSAAQ